MAPNFHIVSAQDGAAPGSGAEQARGELQLAAGGGQDDGQGEQSTIPPVVFLFHLLVYSVHM